MKLHDPTSYARGRDHDKSDLVGHWLQLTQNEWDAIVIDSTDKQ